MAYTWIVLTLCFFWNCRFSTCWSWSNLLMTSTRINLGMAESVAAGAELAMGECQHQFRWERWPCPRSSFTKRNGMRPLTRETSFVHAIMSAGVTYTLTRNCSRGQLEGCGCAQHANEPSKTSRSWRWGGCSDNIKMGEQYAVRVLDSLESGQDAQALANLHNNFAGRLAVRHSLQQSCKCHGVSGSCTMQTCWMQLPSFRVVGQSVKRQYDSAVRVGYSNGILQIDTPSSNKNSASSSSSPGSAQILRVSPQTLVYLETSPDFCRVNSTAGTMGTKGRTCSREKGPGISAGQRRSCQHLCKSCGHKVKRHVSSVLTSCNCTFQWCCQVQCQTCRNTVTRYTCV